MEFLKQACNGLNEWWRYVLGIFIVIFGYAFIGQLPLMSVVGIGLKNDTFSYEDVMQFEKTNDFSFLHLSSNQGLLLMLTIFIFAALGLYVAVKMHKKNILDVITTRRPFDWKRFFYGMGIWMILSIIAEYIIYLFSKENYTMTINWSAFFPLLLISVFILPIQTAFEEVFFRGYINQGVYLMTGKPWVGIVISSIFFSLVHSMNPEIEKFGFMTMQFYYLSAALFLAFICYVDNGLELSIGIHTATNVFGALFVTYEGAVLQTDTLFKIKETNAWLMTFAFLLAAAIFLIIAGKKYKWFDIKPSGLI